MRTPLARTVLAVCVLAAGCTAPAPPDVARLPPAALGSNGDPDVAALNLAQWAFADPARIYGKPEQAARAAAALEYVAGEFAIDPRWAGLSGLTKDQLAQGRAELRRALGVVAGTPSQVVVDRLIAAADALGKGDETAAARQLGPPAFDAPAEQVLARLSTLPYLRMANVGTMRAGDQVFPSGAGNWGE